MTDIHEQLRALLDREGASYRVIEHEPEGRTEVIAKIRGNKVQQSIKSMVLQVRLKKENHLLPGQYPGRLPRGLRRGEESFPCRQHCICAKREGPGADRMCYGRHSSLFLSRETDLLADPLIQENEDVVFNAGRLDRSIMMKLSDYIRIARPQLVSIAKRA